MNVNKNIAKSQLSKMNLKKLLTNKNASGQYDPKRSSTIIIPLHYAIALALTIYPCLSVLITIDFNSGLRIYRIICIIKYKCNMTIYLRWC